MTALSSFGLVLSYMLIIEEVFNNEEELILSWIYYWLYFMTSLVLFIKIL